MTYSVPYSFVPGTKAKADEVNANFNDVIDKLSATNDTVAQKLNLDLSNLDEDGQEILDAKADVTDIDGSWVISSLVLADMVSIKAGNTKTYSLASYLPDDGNIYEVVVWGYVDASTTSGNFASIHMKSSLCGYVPLARFIGATKTDANSATIPVGTDREISVYSTSSQVGTMSFYLKVNSYRKVR